LGEGIHCGLTNERPAFEGTCNVYSPDMEILNRNIRTEDNYKLAMLGKKKITNLFILLVASSIIIAIFSFLTFREFNTVNVLKIIIRTSLEVFLFYMIYVGKSWAKYLIIFLFSIAILLSVFTVIPLISLYPSISIVFILVAIYGFALYKLLADNEIEEFLKYQKENN
jgi:hypothetical protein